MAKLMRVRVDGSGLERLTDDPALDDQAAFSPDGNQLAFVSTRSLQGILFGVTATDAITYAVVAVLLAIVAMAACWIPAWRAMRVDPMVALRYQ